MPANHVVYCDPEPEGKHVFFVGSARMSEIGRLAELDRLRAAIPATTITYWNMLNSQQFANFEEVRLPAPTMRRVCLILKTH